MKMRSNLVRGILTLTLIFNTISIAVAQGGAGNSGYNNPGNSFPLENSVLLLLLLASVYFIFKLWQYRHKNTVIKTNPTGQ